MENLHFKPQQNSFFKGLSKEIYAYLKSKRHGSFAGMPFWIKTLLIMALFTLAYALILTALNHFLLLISYIVLGFSLLLFAFNVAHDASHNSISRNKKLNYILYYSCFMLQGLNGYLWRKRHVEEHHPYPNIPHRDPDLINTRFLRYCKSQPLKKYHRWQAFYALPLYAVYTLFWLFIKDFTRKGNSIDPVQFRRQVCFNVFHKLLYLFLLVGVPYLEGAFSFGWYALCFLCMHFAASIFLVFTFTMSHYISGQPEVIISDSTLQNSWEVHQVVSSVDFHTQSKLALFIFGGFNCHVAHHLFPHVSHVHYPALSKIIRNHLTHYNIPMREVHFLQGIKLHFKLLWEMGRQ
ncbi:MAG TPA: acyl-CoA desaturase [Flavobacteriales bacterium]|nr:acyl-CoA desaturase [Flavobacteriales bacterium]